MREISAPPFLPADNPFDLRNILQQIVDVIFVIDEEGVIRFIGPSCLELFGYHAAEMVGRSFTNFIHPSDCDQSFPSGSLRTPIRRTSNFENRYISKDGTIVPIIWSAKWVEAERLFYCVARDGSEKVRMQERYKALVQNGTDLVTIIDKTCNFLFVSDSVTSILGYTPCELISKNAKDFVHESDLAEAISEHCKVLGKRTPSRVRHRFLHKEGHWIWVEALGTNHLDNPSIEGIVVVSRDIHEQVTLQQKLDQEMIGKQREITSAIIRAQETERSQIALELHDNVNQLLTTVKLYNETFLAGAVQDKELLVKSNQYIQECITEIRNISKRLSMPTLGQISLQDSITELVDSINTMGSLTVEYCLEDTNPELISEDLHLAIYRIIQESLNNILKYARAQKVFIKVKNCPESLILTIGDDGVGFDVNARRSGIGITNMKTRAEQLNASFSIESAPGKGCKIQICFPIRR
ncbi:MAG TPA: PAS domain S-box protein [Chitinophagaceae bacterium]|nr:PAS domain S-box protein [Chitinophagaceae bacterium]